MVTVADILKTHCPFHYTDQGGKVHTAGTYCGAIYLDGMLTKYDNAEVVGQASMSFGTRFLLENGALLDCSISEPERVSQSIRDIYSGLARYAGLQHIGGKGDRSIFEGTKDQWAHMKALVLERATEYNKVSIRAVLARIDWCIE